MTYDPRLFGFSDMQIPASGLTSTLKNESGSIIPGMTPVRADTSGNMALMDVSSELACLAIVGVTVTDVENMTFGVVSLSGRLLDVTTTASFGDIMYVAKDGSLTNVKPSEGISGFNFGDFVVKVGTVVKNEANPLLKDLFLNISVVGQL